MATPEIAQSSVESVHRSTADVMVSTLLELPVDGWPQPITDMLSPDLENNEDIPPAPQRGHDDVTVGTRVSPTPMVPPSTNCIATTDATLSNTYNDNLTSTEEYSLPSTPKTSLPSSPDVGFSESYAALTSDNESALCKKPVKDLALKILGIIERYGHGAGAGTGVDWAGKIKFLPLVELCIQKNEPVKMVLPAFPCVGVFDLYPVLPFACVQRLLP